MNQGDMIIGTSGTPHLQQINAEMLGLLWPSQVTFVEKLPWSCIGCIGHRHKNKVILGILPTGSFGMILSCHFHSGLRTAVMVSPRHRWGGEACRCDQVVFDFQNFARAIYKWFRIFLEHLRNGANHGKPFFFRVGCGCFGGLLSTKNERHGLGCSWRAVFVVVSHSRLAPM